MTPQVPGEVRGVADDLIAALGDDLAALLWHGSWAAGEQTPESDHDMIVVLKTVDDDVLKSIERIFRGRSGWSTFVKSEQELRQYPLSGRLQFHYSFVTLHGGIDAPPVTRGGLSQDLRTWAATINHECRYRIIHGAAREDSDAETGFIRRRNARWMYYQAKIAVMAIKARELLLGRDYPANRAELRERLTDPEELSIVDSVDGWHELREQAEDDFVPTALLLDRFARNVVRQLDETKV